MNQRNEFGRTRRLAGASLLALVCAAVSLAAWAAEPPVAAQSAVSAALGAPAQPTVGVIKPTETPASGGADQPAQGGDTVADLLARRDFQGALDLGATAQDFALQYETQRCQREKNCVPRDASTALFIRQGRFLGVAMADADGKYSAVTMGPVGLKFPGGLDSLPNPDDLIPPAPPPAYVAPVVEILAAGGSAVDAASAYIASLVADPTLSDARLRSLQAIDASSAQWVVSDMGPGRVGLAYTPKTGGPVLVIDLPGTESYPGVAALPTWTQAFCGSNTGCAVPNPQLRAPAAAPAP